MVPFEENFDQAHECKVEKNMRICKNNVSEMAE